MAAKNINDLDNYSLGKIFNLLGIDEWIELHQMTNRFRQIIREHVIPVQKIKVIGPDVNYSMNELFGMFGKCMAKLQFDAKNYVCKGRTRNCAGFVFEVFLQMLLDYCEPGNLKEVWIWNINEKIQNRLIDQDFLTRQAAYFKNVTTLRISFQCDGNACSVRAIERWLASIPDEQIRTLTIQFNAAGQYDFKLHPNSFPNVRNVRFSFDKRNDRCLNKVTDFIRGKSNLQKFYCDSLGDEIVKTVANSFPNIKALGDIDLSSKPEDIRWEELKYLRGIQVRGSMANYKEFHNIFKTCKTLEHVRIVLNHTEDLSIPDKFLSFLKTNCSREKIYLKELFISMRVSMRVCKWDQEMYLKYLVVNVFNFKTLSFHEHLSYELIKSAIANVGCLENVLYYNRMYMPTAEKCYNEWTMEKLMMNRRLGTSNRLTISTDNAEEWITKLGSKYDPKIITLEPISKHVPKGYWF